MRKIAFVFPGQGAQYVGMGKDLYEEFAAARDVFAEADHKLGVSISKLCFKGPEEELQLTVNTQPAILTVSTAILRVFDTAGLKAAYTAGHSLGEYSALVAAGSLTFSDAVWLVRQRGIYMQEAVPPGEGSMAAIFGLSAESCKSLCQEASDAGIVEPANFNSPEQIVIAGKTPAVEKAMKMAKDYGAKRAVKLSVSGPFHCSLLQPASLRLAEALGRVRIKDAEIPVIANVSAEPVTEAATIRENLIKQVSESVKWQQSVEKMLELGVNTFLEIGPEKVLSGFIKKIAKNAEIYNIEDVGTLRQTVAALEGAEIYG